MKRGAEFGTKITVFMAVMLPVAMTFNTFLNYTRASASMAAQLESSMLQYAKSNAAMIGQRLQVYEGDVALSADKVQILTFDWTQQRASLATDMLAYGFLEMGYASSSDGVLNLAYGDPVNIAAQPYFQKALAGVAAVSDPELSRAAGKLVLNIACRSRMATAKSAASWWRRRTRASSATCSRISKARARATR